MKAVFKLLICLFFLYAGNTYCATTTVNENYPPVRVVPVKKIQKFISDRDFQYERNYTVSTSIWDRIWMWIGRLLYRPLLKGHTITVLDIILYAIAIVAIVLIVYYFVRSEKVGIFARKGGKNQLGINVIEEDIHKIDFDRIINDAIASGQYRVAVRYLYLKSLKDLSGKGLITWKPEKTNRDYINEMRPSVFGKLFRDITHLFDYAWYGNTDISATSFASMKDTFEQFNKQLYTEK